MELLGIYIIGVLGRAAIPYLIERLRASDPLSFDWRYLAGQALGGLVGVLPALVAPGFVASLQGTELLVIFGFGWFAGDVGNLAIGKPLVKRNAGTD